MGGRRRAISKASKGIENRWRAVLRLIPGWEDAAIVMPGDTLPDGDLLAWCDLWGLRGTPRAIVEEANDKRTSHRIEVSLGVALPHARLIERLDDLAAAVSQWDGRWIVKDPWGVAGRERRLGRGAPSEGDRNWCMGRLSQGLDLVFEPWVEDAREWSIHFDADDDVTYVGACELLTHGDGTFRGVRPGAVPPKTLVAGATAAAGVIARLGYRGPIGIDAMVGKLGGEEMARPVTEVNARYSFGRLGLELARRTEVERFEWRHDAHRPDEDGPLGPWGDLESGRACRLPDFCDPEGRSGSWCRKVSA